MDQKELQALKERLETNTCYHSVLEHARDIRSILSYVIELETKLKVHEDAETWKQTIERGRKNWTGPACTLCRRGPGVYAGWCSECMSDHDL